MTKSFYTIATTFVAILLKVSVCGAQQKIDENYINEQMSKRNEYTLLVYGLGQATAVKDSIDKWKSAHIKLLFQLQVEGKISFFGPVANDPSIAGIAIFNTTDEAVVKQHIEKDPFVKNKVLTYKLSKWYGIPEQKLLPSSAGNK